MSDHTLVEDEPTIEPEPEAPVGPRDVPWTATLRS